MGQQSHLGAWQLSAGRSLVQAAIVAGMSSCSDHWLQPSTATRMSRCCDLQLPLKEIILNVTMGVLPRNKTPRLQQSQ